MRIRKQDAAGDYCFGRGLADFWVDAPEAVALAAIYRLALWEGDWWLDLSAGTPWAAQIIGRGKTATRDPVLRARVLGTPGVETITGWSSNLDRTTRAFTVSAQIVTRFSTFAIAFAAPLPQRGV